MGGPRAPLTRRQWVTLTLLLVALVALSWWRLHSGVAP